MDWFKLTWLSVLSLRPSKKGCSDSFILKRKKYLLGIKHETELSTHLQTWTKLRNFTMKHHHEYRKWRKAFCLYVTTNRKTQPSHIRRKFNRFQNVTENKMKPEAATLQCESFEKTNSNILVHESTYSRVCASKFI